MLKQGFQQPTLMKSHFKYVFSMIALGLITGSVSTLLLADVVARINDSAYETPTSITITVLTLVVLTYILGLLACRFYPGSEKKESDQSEKNESDQSE